MKKTLSLLLILLTVIVVKGQDRYVNSTDGRDDNDGLTPTTAYMTLTAAFADFPTGCTVHLAAGAYNYNETLRNANGNDAVGYNLAANKSMRFIIESYAGNNTVLLNGNGPLIINIGANNTITFVSKTGQSNHLIYKPQAGTESFKLTTGTLDVSGLASFTIGSNVGTSAGGDIISRTNGFLVGNITYETAIRDVVFEAGGITSITTGTFVPTDINTLRINSVSGTIKISNGILTFAQGIPIAITNTGAANVEFLGAVNLYNAGILPVARIVNNVANSQWTFTGGINISTTVVDGGDGNATISNNQTGKILIPGLLALTNGNFATLIENVSSGTLTVSGGVQFTPNTSLVPTIIIKNSGNNGVLNIGGNNTTKLNSVQSIGNNTVNNISGGSLTISSVSSTGDNVNLNINCSAINIQTNVSISGTGSTIGFSSNGAISIGGNLSNTGTNIVINIGSAVLSTLVGNMTLGASSGTLNLTGRMSVGGVLSNGTDSNIKLGSFNLELTGNGLVHTNNGSITATGGGILNFNTSGALVNWNGSGSVPSIQVDGSGSVSLNTITYITGNVQMRGAGTLTFSPSTTITGALTVNAGNVVFNNPTRVYGNIINSSNLTFLSSITASGDLTNSGLCTFSNLSTFEKDLNLTGGTFTLGATAFVTGSLYQSGGAITFGANKINISKNYIRTTGGINEGTGKLEFTTSGTHLFQGGTNFQIHDLFVTGPGSNVIINSGSIRLSGDCYIGTNATITMDTYNLRFVGTGSTIINAGSYQSTNGGRVIFEGPDVGGLGTPGTVHTIYGPGEFGDMEIALTDESDFVSIAASQNIVFNRLLILRQGTIDIPATSSLNPVATGTGKIIRNLSGAGMANGHSFNISPGGQFNSNMAPYDLEYDGILSANQTVGNEFYVGTAGALVRNLTISATDNVVNGLNTVQFPTNVAGDYKYSGNLTVPVLAEVDITGNSNLISTLASASNSIVGAIWNSGAGEFRIVGGSITSAQFTTSAPVPTGSVQKLRVTATSSQSISLWNISNLTIDAANSAEVTISMVNLANNGTIVPGTIVNYTQNAGNIILGNNANVEVFVSTDGNFDFNTYNLWISDLSSGLPVNSFTAGGSATFTATNIGNTNGFLQFRSSGALNSQISSSAVSFIPRIEIDPNGTGGIVVTLTGDSGSSDLFFHKKSNSTLALGNNKLILSGNNWTTAGLYTATSNDGKIVVSGPVNLLLQSSVTVPNIEIINAGNTFLLTDNDGAATVPDLTISGILTLTAGNINLQNIDLILTQLTAVAPCLIYSDGIISAINGQSIPLVDNETGEIIFAGGGAQSYQINGTNPLNIPNLTLAALSPVTYSGGNLINAPITRISKYFKFSSDFTMGRQGQLTFGDDACIEIMSGIFDQIPNYDGKISYCYNTSGNYTTDKELPSNIQNIQKFYVAPGNGNIITLNIPITVNSELRLLSGDLKTSSSNYVSMSPNSILTRVNGTINASGVVGGNIIGGPINLTYSNTIPIVTTDGEYPLSITVNRLIAGTNIGAPSISPAPSPLTLHADRTCESFTLLTDGPVNPQNGTQFDLNGNTVTILLDATLTRGALVSYKVVNGKYVYGTLSIGGGLTLTGSSNISNVNLSASTASLVGQYGVQDYDGAGPNSLPALLPLTVVRGVTTVAAFNGDLTVHGNLTLTGVFGPGTITSKSNLSIANNALLTQPCNFVFIGEANQNFQIPTNGITITGLTLNQPVISTVTLIGGNLTTIGLTTFINGVLVTGANSITMWHPTWNASPGNPQGFDRSGVVGTNVSHIMGNVIKRTVNAGVVGWIGSSEPRIEFPTGTSAFYRPLVITFNSQIGGIPSIPNTTITVSHIVDNPKGTAGLPIDNGIKVGTSLSRYPSFYWMLKTSTNVDPSIRFDLELNPTGFTGFSSTAMDCRIIRRHGSSNDFNNLWLLQGYQSGTPIESFYDNEYNNSTGRIAVINRNSIAGLRSDGAIFTIGLATNLIILNPINNATGKLAYVRGVRTPQNDIKFVKDLENSNSKVFGNNVGPFVYTVTSSNESIATASISGTTLTVTPVSSGTANISITAWDNSNNDFVSYSFPLEIGIVGSDVDEIVIPTEYSVSQNYPNPFNPTTIIRYGIPKESHVNINVINILGQVVANLIDEIKPAGFYSLAFNGTGLASGTYIAIIKADEFSKTVKMKLVK